MEGRVIKVVKPFSQCAGKHVLVEILSFIGVFLILMGIVCTQPLLHTHAAAGGTPGTWSTYMANNARTGFLATETSLNPGNATGLHVHWKYHAGGGISVQPTVVNNVIYWGAWDGYEYASNLDGSVKWKSYLGITAPKNANCNPPKAGVASPSTVVTMPVNGVSTQVVLVGGGNSKFYALNAADGHVIWSTLLGNANTMIWDGPAVYNGHVYIGMASYGDCPLTPGQLIELNATTGQIEHTFTTVPNGCVGGGIWGAPAIDEAAGVVYVSTGTIYQCAQGEPMAYALIALHAADLSLIGSWQVPATDRGADSDFGSTPTLFQATINGAVRLMVGLVNKNGIYYAFDRTNIKAGPLWQKTIAITAPGAKSSFSSSAWDGKRLYSGDAGTKIGGRQCGGSLRAHDPATGNYLWEYCASGRVVGALMVTGGGLVMAGANQDFVVLDAATGKQVFVYHDGNAASRFWGAPTVANGIIYMGNRDGMLYAFGL
jgi:outer membrane protein assembly factor BamB